MNCGWVSVVCCGFIWWTAICVIGVWVGFVIVALLGLGLYMRWFGWFGLLFAFEFLWVRDGWCCVWFSFVECGWYCCFMVFDLLLLAVMFAVICVTLRYLFCCLVFCLLLLALIVLVIALDIRSVGFDCGYLFVLVICALIVFVVLDGSCWILVLRVALHGCWFRFALGLAEFYVGLF